MTDTERQRLVATLPRKRIGAGVLFVDERERVLLVEPTYKEHWEIPGGIVEADEAPLAAAVREVREELGLTVTPGRLLVLDWVPSGLHPGDGLMLIFAGDMLTADQVAAITLPGDELRSWRWCDEREAGQRLLPIMARRVAAALDAHRNGRTGVYLEDGVPSR